MTELFSLIKNLDVDEQKAVKISFKKFISAEEESFLLEKLFNHILSEKEKIKTDKQLSVLLYQKEKLSAIAKLKSRLFYFILEVLSSDSLLRKEELFDPCEKQIIRIRKKMLQFRVIYRKKNRAEFSILIHLLNEIIWEAKEYEQFDTMVEALIFKKYLLKLRKGESEIEDVVKKITFYSLAHKMMIIANDHYFNLIADQEVVGKLEPKQKQKMLKQAIVELTKYVHQTNSANIGYINKLLELEYLVSQGNHKKTVDKCLDIITHLNKYQQIYRKEWVGWAYDNISHCLVFNNDYENAAINSKKAQTYYSPKSNSWLASKQQEFYVFFYSGQYKHANEIVKELLNLPLVNIGDFRYNKYLFLNACALFKLGFYTEALSICNKTQEITKDKVRWDIGIRYLKFMCLVELEEFDKAPKIVDAFRKIIDRSKQTISSRDILIYNMLNEYSRKGFYSRSSLKLETFCTKLDAKKNINSWNYYTHELIPIHSWVETKIKSNTTKK